MYHSLKPDTILVSDAHYNRSRDDFKYFLQDIDDDKIKTSQLILMGDMFDLLVAKVDHTIEYNKEIIVILESISKKIEVIYLEGNHDFALDGLFENIKIVPIEKQPITFEYNDKKIAIAHGDFSTGDIVYTTYLKLIRAKTLLTILNIVDKLTNCYISKKIISNQIEKPKCIENSNFENIAKKRIALYSDIDIIIEGHYHQGKEYSKNGVRYINIAAFVCTKEYLYIKDI
jgi:UDP-2,3-diacylglucosamine hydrolase